MTSKGRVAFNRMDEVIYGVAAAEAVLDVIDRLGAKRVAMMASGSLDRATDAVTKIRTALGDRLVVELDSVPPHSPRAAVIEAVRRTREADADLILTVGGGSITDAVKAVRLCLANGVDTTEAMDVLRPGAAELADATIPQVCVPTTLSAGEFSAFAGITDERTKVKEVSVHPSMIPSAVILDPAMTTATPEWLFLSTGIRAIDHCVEGLCSTGANPFADAQALRGISLLASGLARVKADPNDLAARLDCQLGSWLSMAPISTGVPMGASHGIGYVLGAAFDVPHGYTSCVMLPAVLTWNREFTLEQQNTLAAAIGKPGEDLAQVLSDLIRELGLPRTLKEIDVTPEQHEAVATAAMETRWIPFNPRPVTQPSEVLEILRIAESDF